MKKSVARITEHPTPVVRSRLAAMLDSLSAECLSLARDERACPEDYERLAGEIETLAVSLRALTGAAEASGTRKSLTLEEAKRVIEALRAEDAVRNDVQRALA
jgi:hypothetical protein